MFQAARDTAPQPSDDLLARLLADAAAQAAPVAAPTAVPRRGVLAALLAAIGGWPAAAGLATAAVAGLMIGYVAPDALGDLSGGYLETSGYRLEDLMPSYGDLLGEG